MNYGQIVFAIGLVAITSFLTYRAGNQFRRGRRRTYLPPLDPCSIGLEFSSYFFRRIWHSGRL